MSNMKRAILKSTLANSKMSSASSVSSQRFFDCPPSLKISPFWGADDYINAEDWIELYDSIAADYNYNSLNKIIRLGGYLRKHALVWYVQALKQFGKVDNIEWPTFKEMFKKQFNIPFTNERASSSDGSSAASSIGR